MIIIGEKINGAIPSIKQAIAEKNEALIIERTLAQANAGANFLVDEFGELMKLAGGK